MDSEPRLTRSQSHDESRHFLAGASSLPPTFTAFVLFTVLALGAVLYTGCDKNQLGFVDSKDLPPNVRSLRLAPDSIYVDSLAAPGGTYSVSLVATAKVADPDGGSDIASVAAAVIGPDGSMVATGIPLHDDGAAPDSVRGDGTFSGVIQFSTTREQAGQWQVRASATDKAGSVSNIYAAHLKLARKNSRPVISLFPSVRQFTSSGDSTRLFVSVAVADSDGLDDIASVSVQTLNARDSVSQFPMFDDGSLQHGDLFPGDGVFSSAVWVTPLHGLQNVEVVFVARDRQGAFSDTSRKTLQNSPPHIVRLVVPDSIQRPTSGTSTISFFLEAADSDGLGDIDSVYFRNISAANPSNFLMYDDGNLPVHGDTTRGDGVYSILLSISPTNTPGREEFHFYVVDKSGASDLRIKFITIY